MQGSGVHIRERHLRKSDGNRQRTGDGRRQPPDIKQVAIAIYGDLARRKPLGASLRIRLARCLAQLDLHREALATVAEGLALVPDAADLLIQKVEILRRSGELNAAERAIAVLAGPHPQHPRLASLRADLAVARGDHARAAAINAEAVRARPLDVSCRTRLARNLLQLERPSEALAILADGLARVPDAAELLILQIAVLQRSGRLEVAEQAIAALAGQHPQHPRLPSLRADLAAARGDHARAAEINGEQVRVRPLDASCRARLVDNFVQLERYGEALMALGDGLALVPDAADMLVLQVTVLQRSGRLEEAEQAIAALAARHPQHSRLSSLRADLAVARGDYVTAAAINAEEVRAKPLDVNCRTRLADNLLKLARHDDALAILAEGLALAPGAVGLLILQATALQRTGQLEAAGQAIAAVASQQADHPRLPSLQADLAAAQGCYRMARELLEADLARWPFDIRRRLRLATRLQQEGFAREALALVGAPRMPTEAERLARLNLLMQLGHWEDVATELDGWSADTPRADAARLKVRTQFALLKFDFVAARSLAQQSLAANPHDVAANQALSLAATLTFDTKCAWAALLKVPYVPRGMGAARLGRPLRNILGQIVNEARLRPEESRLLASAAGLSNDEQVQAAATLLRAESENICPALALLIGIARAGRHGDSAARGPVRRRIPRQLHQYWDAEPPPDVERLMKEASEANPGYSYRRWDDRTACRYLSALGVPDVLRAYREARHAAIRADIFRLGILFAEGGVYLDADDRCTKSIESLLPEDAEAVFYQEHTGSVGNNFMAAKPGHPLIEAALNQAVRAVLEGAGESTWLATGPGLMSRVVAAAIARDPALHMPAHVRIVPLWAFRDTVQPCRALAYKLSTRHWQRAALN